MRTFPRTNEPLLSGFLRCSLIAKLQEFTRAKMKVHSCIEFSKTGVREPELMGNRIFDTSDRIKVFYDSFNKLMSFINNEQC